MINRHTTPAGKIAYCIDERGHEGYLEVGSSYVIQYWDGCCVNVIGDDGIGITVNANRFEERAPHQLERGVRYGNNRHMYADLKVKERRIDRARGKQALRQAQASGEW